MLSPLMERQLALEARMIDSGHKRFEMQVQQAITQGRLADTSLGLKIFRKAKADFAARLLDDQTPKMGPKASADKYIADVPAEEIAHLVIRAVVNGAAQVNATPQALIVRVAQAVEAYVPKWDAPKLTKEQRLKIGMSFVARLRQAVPDLVQETGEPKKPGDVNLMTLAPEIAEEIERAPEIFGEPRLLPALLPPVPWMDLTERGTGGGYHTEALRRRVSVMRTERGPVLSELAHVDLSQVLAALNTVQATPWRINRPVYDAMLAEVTVWSRARRACMDVATAFLGDVFYFPHNLDWRGRLYPLPTGLTPQGNDAEKGLLTFARGEPITTEDQRRFLAIHGATLFGKTKRASFDERIAWVEENETRLLSMWRDADQPWQFLAFAHEWTAFQREGYGYVSHLPVGMDATCSVYQHMAAMLRDPALGRMVNMMPGEEPQDLYQDVAEAVGNLGPMARKIVKPVVMTTPYGAGQKKRREKIEEEREKLGLPKMAYADLVKLTEDVDAAIHARAPGALALLKWFCDEVAPAANKRSMPIRWTTPAGLPVILRKLRTKRKKIPLVIRQVGCYRWFRVTVKPERLDKMAQRRGLAPNFIHSLDAAHLMLTVNASAARGVTSFAMVHDCYGTVAADAPVLAEVLRGTFAAMYTEHDPLAELVACLKEAGVEAPAALERGELDVNLVRESDYFFS